MSGFELIAGVVGVSDVAIKSIVGLYNYVADLKDAPSEIQRIRAETQGVVTSLRGLEFLTTADKTIQNEAKRVGLAQSVETCGKTCRDLEKDLKNWTKSGPQALSSRIKVVQHKARIARYTTEICTAKSTISLAVGIAHLAYAATNRSASRGEIARHTRALQDTVARAVKEATEEQRSAERLAIDCQQRLVKDADDGCAGMAAMEAEKQSDASEELRAKCEIANETLATYSQARITMGNVTVDATSENQSGLSAAIIDKVSWFKIGNVSVSNNSKNKCGIW